MESRNRKYTNGEITVYWKPATCIHATTCYRELGRVFNPRKRPWVNMEGASTDRIIEIVRKCPTDALTYEWNNPEKISEKPPEAIADAMAGPGELMDRPVEIRIMKNGPYVVDGSFRVINAGGDEEKPMRMTSFCRCGASGEMPYCDGSHRLANFTDDKDGE